MSGTKLLFRRYSDFTPFNYLILRIFVTLFRLRWLQQVYASVFHVTEQELDNLQIFFAVVLEACHYVIY